MNGTPFDPATRLGTGAAQGRRSCLAAGVIGVGLGAWGVIHWWPLALTLLRGFLPLILLVGGVIALIAAITPSDVKDLDAPPSEKPPHAL